MCVLKISLYDIIVCSCVNNKFFPNITEIIFAHSYVLWPHQYDCYYAFDQRLSRSTVTSFLRNILDDAIVAVLVLSGVIVTV